MVSTEHAHSASSDRSGEEPWLAEFNELFEGVEDLIKRVADVESPEIQKVRAKVRIALMVAKSAVRDAAAPWQRGVRQIVDSTDDYVRLYPWQTICVALIMGITLGAVAGATD